MIINSIRTSFPGNNTSKPKSFKQLQYDEDGLKTVPMSYFNHEKVINALPQAKEKLDEDSFVKALIYARDNKPVLTLFNPLPSAYHSKTVDITDMIDSSSDSQELSEKIYNRAMEIVCNNEFEEDKDPDVRDDDDYDFDDDTLRGTGWDLTDAYIP